MAHRKNEINLSCLLLLLLLLLFLLLFIIFFPWPPFSASVYNTKINLEGGKKLQRRAMSVLFSPGYLWRLGASWLNQCISDSGLLILHPFLELFTPVHSHFPQSVPIGESMEDVND